MEKPIAIKWRHNLLIHFIMLNNELLMEVAALVNSNEAKIAQLQADVECASGCGICGYGSN